VSLLQLEQITLVDESEMIRTQMGSTIVQLMVAVACGALYDATPKSNQLLFFFLIFDTPSAFVDSVCFRSDSGQQRQKKERQAQCEDHTAHSEKLPAVRCVSEPRTLTLPTVI
jgi:hypothetical protein